MDQRTGQASQSLVELILTHVHGRHCLLVGFVVTFIVRRQYIRTFQSALCIKLKNGFTEYKKYYMFTNTIEKKKEADAVRSSISENL